ncbi:hypothetical protein Tco_1441755 [Tanacetum coccineum]
MSTPAYVDSKTITQAQLVDTYSESDPEEAPSEAEELQSLGSRVPLIGEQFEAVEPSSARTDSSHLSALSDSTTPLSSDHPLTHVSPTPTPTRVSFHHRTVCIAIGTQPTLSPSMSARIAEAAALSLSSFCKRYISSYNTSSSSPTLPVRKRYRGTSELILDTNSERDELREEGDEHHGLDDSQGLEDEGLGLEEEEVVLRGQRQTVLVVETAATATGRALLWTLVELKVILRMTEFTIDIPSTSFNHHQLHPSGMRPHPSE